MRLILIKRTLFALYDLVHTHNSEVRATHDFLVRVFPVADRELNLTR